MANRWAAGRLRGVDIREQFGAAVRRLRLERKMTQEALAHEAGQAVPYLSRLEGGRNNASLAVIADLALALGVQPIELFRDILVAPTDPRSSRKRSTHT